MVAVCGINRCRVRREHRLSLQVVPLSDKRMLVTPIVSDQPSMLRDLILGLPSVAYVEWNHVRHAPKSPTPWKLPATAPGSYAWRFQQERAAAAAAAEEHINSEPPPVHEL